MTTPKKQLKKEKLDFTKPGLANIYTKPYMTQKENSWEERFEEVKKQFIHNISWGGMDGLNILDFDLFKEFTLKELSQARREERQKVVEWAEKNERDIKNYPQTMNTEVSIWYSNDLGYNQALTDLLTNLTNK